MSILGGIMRPVTNLADKSAKAGKLKSIKIKAKFDPKAKKQADDQK